MSNIVTIVHNDTDTQVEVNGREIANVAGVKYDLNEPGDKTVIVTFTAAQLNIIGVNAKRDTYFDGRDNQNKPLTRWQRIKAWWKRMERSFEQWQNGDYRNY